MEFESIGKLAAGLSVGKLEKYGLTRIGVSYPMFGVDLIKLGLGIAQVATGVYTEKRVGLVRDVGEILGVAGVGLIIDELAKATGINPGSPQIQVNRKYSPVVVPPEPELVKVD